MTTPTPRRHDEAAGPGRRRAPDRPTRVQRWPVARVRLPLAVLVGVATVAVFVLPGAPGVVDPADADPPGTEAPDLLEVGNFRAGPSDDDGGDQTLVDFTFDDTAHLNGGDHSNFHLVPVTADDAVDGRGLPPEQDREGDEVVTVLYDGDLAAADFARGYVDTGVVNADANGVSSDAPGNINQSEPIRGGSGRAGTTANPDLVSVRFDGDQVLYEFDQALTADDVVQNNSGLRLYFPEANQSSTIPSVGAAVAAREDDTTMRATFPGDLPEDYDLGDAVGAFVQQNTVQADGGGANGGANAFQDLAPVEGEVSFCEPAPETGESGSRRGPTDAPDLVAVGNFRSGPTTAQGTRTTCVDFVFDQPTAIVNGGQASFQLVPLDGTDAVSGTTNVTAPDDRDGDRVITIPFPGVIAEGDVARGYVDAEVLSSDPGGATNDDPSNISQSADVGDATTTDNPDVTAITVDGDQVLFEFDQDLTSDDVSQNSSGLRLYFSEPVGSNARIPFAGSSIVQREGPRTLRATYNTLPGELTLDDAVGGYVVQGTVQAAEGERGGNDGVNAFHELAPLDDTGAVVCAEAPETGEQGDGSGPTIAPDVVSVGNFRRGPVTSQGTPTTCVDVVFDQVAWLVGGDVSNFGLVPVTGDDAISGTPNVTARDAAGDRVVTVPFPGELVAEDFARGYVDSEVVSSRESGANADNPTNVNQSADLSPTTDTQNPDVVSITIDGDQVLFAFDQDLTTDDVVQNTSGLRLYFPEPVGSNSTIPFVGSSLVQVEGPRTLRATYNEFPGEFTIDEAVGGYVVQGSVQAAPDEAGANDGANGFHELTPLDDTGATVCEAATQAGEEGDESGPTTAPDLQAIGNFRRGPASSQGGQTTCVDFVFDQPAWLNGGDQSNFALVPADGGDAVSGTTNVTAASDVDGDRVVTVAFPGRLDPADVARGFVDTGVVNSDEAKITARAPANVNQSADITPGEATDNPDLVGAELRDDSFLFRFDQDLTADDVIQNSSGLRLYFPDVAGGATIALVGSSQVERVDARTLRAFYKDLPGDYTVSDAVGAFVVQGTVQAAPGEQGGNDGANGFHEISGADASTATVTLGATFDGGSSGDAVEFTIRATGSGEVQGALSPGVDTPRAMLAAAGSVAPTGAVRDDGTVMTAQERERDVLARGRATADGEVDPAVAHVELGTTVELAVAFTSGSADDYDVALDCGGGGVEVDGLRATYTVGDDPTAVDCSFTATATDGSATARDDDGSDGGGDDAGGGGDDDGADDDSGDAGGDDDSGGDAGGDDDGGDDDGGDDDGGDDAGTDGGGEDDASGADDSADSGDDPASQSGGSDAGTLDGTGADDAGPAAVRFGDGVDDGSGSASGSGSGGSSDDDAQGEVLAHTGAASPWLVALAVALLTAGVVLVRAGRRLGGAEPPRRASRPTRPSPVGPTRDPGPRVVHDLPGLLRASPATADPRGPARRLHSRRHLHGRRAPPSGEARRWYGMGQRLSPGVSSTSFRRPSATRLPRSSATAVQYAMTRSCISSVTSSAPAWPTMLETMLVRSCSSRTCSQKAVTWAVSVSSGPWDRAGSRVKWPWTVGVNDSPNRSSSACGPPTEFGA